MTFKDFIKPTIAKIISAVILLFIPFIKSTPSCTTFGDCIEKYYSLFTLSLNNYILVGVIILLASIIITYLISCLVVHIYKKIRSQK